MKSFHIQILAIGSKRCGNHSGLYTFQTLRGGFSTVQVVGRLKADSHIACRSHAMPLRTYNVSFPFDIHSAAVSDSHLPCHVLTMPFFSRPRHSTAVERRSVGYLPAFGFFRLPRGVPRRLSEAYQSSSQRSIPTTVKIGSSTLQKKTMC